MSRRKFETDMASNLLTVEERGRREGKINEKLEVARKMKAADMGIDTIAQFTDLSIAEITEL